MAVVLLFRLAILVAPTVWRLTASSQPSNLFLVEQALRQYWERLGDPDEDPEELQSEMSSEEVGFVVTDFTGTFELRKLQWRLSRSPAGGTVEDQDVMTFHFIKAPSGTPAAWVDSTDLPLIETAVGTYWTAVKSFLPSFVHSDQYRWYKDGPAFWELNEAGTEYVPITPNPAVRVTEVDVPGTSTETHQMPPQVALTMTEKTSVRSAWGRWYLPLSTSLLLDSAGRIGTADVDALNGSAVTFYNSCRSSSLVPVVWSKPKPERPKKPSGTLPPWPATAFEVLSIQTDNLWDIIRRRRYDAPTYRKVTTLT